MFSTVELFSPYDCYRGSLTVSGGLKQCFFCLQCVSPLVKAYCHCLVHCQYHQMYCVCVFSCFLCISVISQASNQRRAEGPGHTNAGQKPRRQDHCS